MAKASLVPLAPDTTASSLPSALSREISLNLEQVSLERALKEIAAKAGVDIVYLRETVVAADKTISLNLEAVPVGEALEAVLEGTGLQLLMHPGSDQLILPSQPVSALPGRGALAKSVLPGPAALAKEDVRVRVGAIIGTVTDSLSGETLAGVNVVVAGTQQEVATDVNGRFTIAGLDPGTHTLQASLIGYETKTISGIEVVDGDTVEVNFALEQSAIGLEEIVVIGYGVEQASDVTGSISSVSSEDLIAISTSNFVEALQGQASGVLITQSSGEPGSGMDVMIRGASTLGSTDPLYVIDGVPLDGDLSSLNTANIESVEILKDASAAAIYGSRAANGVVLITTKRGNAGGIQFQFSARSGVSYVPERRRIDMMNTQDFFEFSVDAYENAGLPIPEAWLEPNLSQNLQQNTDWQAAMFRRATVQNYNLTVSGGSEDAVYSFTAGYLDQEGVVVSDAFDRTSFRMNSEFYLGENDNLTIGESLELSRTSATGAVGTDTFKETYQQSPTVPLRCPENLGGFCGPTTATSPGFRLNQVALLNLQESQDITQRLVGSAYADYAILPNLSYRLNLAADLSTGEDQTFVPLYDLKSNVNTERDLDQQREESRALIVENTLNYNLNIADVHQVDVLGGFTQEKREFEFISAEANGFPSGHLRTINSATGQRVVSGGATASSLRSFLGRLQYEYDDRYRAQFAIRRDGSSRFGSERRWGTFPSVSLGWSMHNESFMSNLEDLSRLTWRASWGVTGTQQIPDFAAIPTVEPVANYVFGSSPVLGPGSAVLELGNSLLQWQETKQFDVGVDVGLFNDRLSFVLDYFQKNTSNLLLQVPVPTTSGIRRGNGAFQNVGEVKNSGFEVGASYAESFGDLSLRVSGNVATVSNEVQSLGVEEIIATESDELGSGSSITRPGTEIGAFYGYIAEGPFRDQADVDGHATQPGAGPGDLKFRDINGDGVIDPNDRTIIGSPFPDFFYGMTADLSYKRLGLHVQMDGVQGRDVFALRSDNDPKGFNNATTDFLDRWTPENPDGRHPRAHTTDPNSNLRSSTYRVKDGSFLALRNVTLDYNVDPALLSQLVDVSNLRVYVSASNLFWLTPYDGYNPEIGAGGGNQASLTRSFDGGSYPISTTFEVGVDFGF